MRVKQEEKNRKPISILRKLLIAMISVVLLQGILFMVIILVGGQPRLFRENSCDLMEEDIYSHSTNLSNIMNSAAQDVQQYQEKIVSQIEQVLEEQKISADQFLSDMTLQNQIAENLYEDILILLRRTRVSGGFVILGDIQDNAQEQKYSGFYLRDFDPNLNRSDDDLVLVVGSGTLATTYSLALDTTWNAEFILQPEKNDSFFRPVLETAHNNPTYAADKLGYWSLPFSLRDGDIQIITYSIPLMNHNHEIYGVMGIELSMDYLKKCFSLNKEISQNSDSYTIVTTNSGKNVVYKPMFSIKGELPEKYRDSFLFYNNEYSRNVYLLDDYHTYGCVKNLNLYNRTSPYYGQNWLLAGMTDKSNLFKDSASLFEAVAIAFTVSLLISVVIIIWTGRRFINPVTEMIHKIRDNNSRSKLVLKPMNVKELNELAQAVMNMDESIRENASKLSTIVNLVNIPLGAIEYDLNSEWAFCTKQAVRMLNLDVKLEYGNFVPREKIEQFFRCHDMYDILEKNQNIVKRLYGECQFEDEQWIRFITQKNKNKTLVAVMDVSKEIKNKQKLEYERDFDILTQLLNHRAFKERVKEKLRQSQSNLGAMIMWDLDNLKFVNDNYGHDFGDQYIKYAAKVFGKLTIEGAVVGRISGDEFMAYMPYCSSKEEMMRQLGAIKDELNETKLFLPDGKVMSIRASAGIAWYPDDADDYDLLKKKADFAMYDTKNTYKGFYKEFDKDTYERDAMLLESKEELNRIIEEKAIKYAFQPIVDIKTGEIMAYEALMRPQSRQLSTPTDVMRVASAQSKLFEIERLTSILTMEAYNRQRDEFKDAKIFINSIPNQFMVCHDEAYIEENKDNYRHIVLEIIESEQTDANCMETKRHWAKKYGAGIALDDYGTGYNTESTLLYIAPQYVKIDMSIIQGVSEDNNRRKLVQNLVSYAKPRNIKIIAEGVETVEDLKTLIYLDVDYVQGFYIARPKEKVEDIREEVKQEIRECYRKVQKMDRKVE